MFARLYLKDDDGNPLEPSDLHWEWYDYVLALIDGRLRTVVIQAPKSHAKSTIFSKVVPLWLTCAVNPNIRLVNGSVNSELAEQFLLSNRNELESNELLISDFGPFKPDRGKWTMTRLVVRRSTTSQSPTWRAVGTGKTVQGGRADGVIGDDLADLENSMTQRQRDKVEEWTTGDLMGTLEPDGWTILVGTAKHNNDLLARFEAKFKAEPRADRIFKRYDAIVDEEQRTTLWPARWPYETLMEKKADVGTVTFNRDYRNIAVNDETSLFSMELLERAKRPELAFVERYGDREGESDTVTAGIDLAIIEDERQAQAADGDYTVITVWQKLPSGGRRLLWGERRRGMGFTPQIQLAEMTLRRYKGLRIAIVEANQAQRWFASALLTSSRGDLPIKKHVTGRGVRVDLYEGIPSLQALFEAGVVELPYGDDRSRKFVDILVNELHGLGVESHDDTVLSMWLNEIGVRRLSSSVSWTKMSTRLPPTRRV